jgi:hypothetical protein
MSGKSALVSKAMSLFMNMDELIGKDFERGLSMLKMVSETNGAAAPK